MAAAAAAAALLLPRLDVAEAGRRKQLRRPGRGAGGGSGRSGRCRRVRAATPQQQSSTHTRWDPVRELMRRLHSAQSATTATPSDTTTTTTTIADTTQQQASTIPRRALMQAAAAIACTALARDTPAAASTTTASWLGEAEGGEAVASIANMSAPIVITKGSRVYDARPIGQPLAVTEHKGDVIAELTSARVVYLGESERLPDPHDQQLELEIVKATVDRLRADAIAAREKDAPWINRQVTIALGFCPQPYQDVLDDYIAGRVELSAIEDRVVGSLPENRWEGYVPLLKYARENRLRLAAAAPPPEVLRLVQAHGIAALRSSDKKRYGPPLRGFPYPHDSVSISASSSAFTPSPYRYAQARAVVEYSAATVIAKELQNRNTLVVAITGASHVRFGRYGTGVPARLAQQVFPPKKAGGGGAKDQVVILLNPERQRIRTEGDVPEAEFLWYAAAKPCTENCFDRAEAGVERGVISPDILQRFLDLDSNPLLSAAARRFQGLRERWLADPQFVTRLLVEESISITTTLIAEVQKRGPRFWAEIQYVATDVIRGSVVDFFTVWLPAPTLSFHNAGLEEASNLPGWLSTLRSLPENAFQRAMNGEKWSLADRILSVFASGAKLFGVGVVANLGTLSITNAFVRWKGGKNNNNSGVKQSPVLKTSLVYGTFLATSSNLRYQFIAGVVEHWLADYLLVEWPLAGAFLSFVTRTANSFWGTSQWIDTARFFQLQSKTAEPEASPATDASTVAASLESVHITTQPYAESNDCLMLDLLDETTFQQQSREVLELERQQELLSMILSTPAQESMIGSAAAEEDLTGVSYAVSVVDSCTADASDVQSIMHASDVQSIMQEVQ
eukprot:jgi/Chlat1/1702/Chrsp127S01934